MNPHDYASQLKANKRKRLEAISLELLSGLVVGKLGLAVNDKLIDEAIDLAKEFIKKIDEEEV